MSDDVSVYGEEDHHFHSAFDLDLDPVAIEHVKRLVLGHLLFLAGLALTLLLSVKMGSVWVTPLFGLPLVWAARRHRGWAWAAAFLVVLPAIHYVAVLAAQQSQVSDSLLVPGLIGGAVGGVGSFATLWLLGLLRRDTTTLILASIGAIVLAGIGSFGLFLSMTTSGDGFAGVFLGQLWLYVPWQLFFAYVLAKTLCPAGN